MLDPRLLQLCDSAFPSGAFSQSFGLETAVVEGRVVDAAGFAHWLDGHLCGSLATLDARALVLTMRDGAANAIDAALSAAVFAGDLRAANRRLARATLEAYRAMGLGDPEIAAYAAAIDGGAAHGHLAVACALGYHAIGASERDGACAYLSTAAAGLAAVAARAVPLGQRDLGRILWDCRSTIEACAADACEARTLDDLSVSAFDCEIDALRHERLDARMFAS